ncbi:MAG: right-handed parallel beta-helix repeat-containing protein [Planctomycetota bacterium]|nr:right-handed parallel beta-helix repeat-containing protein [Planctomycetota bacterium]
MKKIFLFLVLLFIPQVCFATMSSSIIFEFRSTATANMVNGGGFKTGASGTDYSTQNAAQWTATDLACTTPSTTVTSATGGFTSAAVGNVIHITAGTNLTIGWYEITAFTDANTLVLDRTPAPSLSGSAGTFYIGGALNVGGSLEDDFFEEISGANTTDGVTVYFYNNNTTSTVTFTPSEIINIAGTGGTTAPIRIYGYKTTRGDNPAGNSRPTIACGANSFTSSTNFDFYNLQLTGTASYLFSAGTNSKTVNCKFTNSSTTAGRAGLSQATFTNLLLLDCELISYRGRGLDITGSLNIHLIGSYLHDSDIGFRWTGTGAGTPAIINCIFDSHVTAAIQMTAASTSNLIVEGCTLYGSENTTGTGISLAAGQSNARFVNNIIYGFATGASHGTAGQTVTYDDYNDYFNNDTDVSNVTKGDNDLALNPTFTSVAQVTGTTATYAGSTLTDAGANFNNVVNSQDFIYIVSGTGVTAGQYLITSHTQTTVTTDLDAGENTAANIVYQVTTGRNFAIGTNLKAEGFPGAFQAALSTGYKDIGAVQRQEPAGANDIFGIIQ